MGHLRVHQKKRAHRAEPKLCGACARHASGLLTESGRCLQGTFRARVAAAARARAREGEPRQIATKATSPKQRQEMCWGGSSALQTRISVWRAGLCGLGGSLWAAGVCPDSGLGSFSRRRESWHLPTNRDASEANCKPTEPCVRGKRAQQFILGCTASTDLPAQPSQTYKQHP